MELRKMEVLNIFKIIQTLCYIDTNYSKDCFDHLSQDVEGDEKDNKFLIE